MSVHARISAARSHRVARQFLDTPEGQEIIAKNFYRPSDPAVLARHASDFPPIDRFDITTIGNGWDEVQAKYFGDGGVFDSFYKPK